MRRFIGAHSVIWMICLELLMSSKEVSTDDVNITGRISKGEEVTCREFPYQINFIANFFCGGFVVSDRYILTAAHCVQNVSPSAVVLRSGSTFRRNGTILPIEEVIPNPDYNSETFDMDIAVMKTTQPIVFNDCTQPVPLPPKGESPKPGQIMTVSGWGYTKKGSYTLPDKLMAVNLKIVSRKLCEAAYPTMTSNMLCAGSLKGGQSACQGDSGGVGVIDDVARGVVSFGRVCGQALAPSAFTDLSAPPIRDFITEITGL